MAKRSVTKGTTKDTETLLRELVKRVAPAEVRLTIPRWASVRERAEYELTATTRGCTISWVGKTIAEAAGEALEYVETPEPDPFQPAWSGLSRMQREVVLQTLREHAARHRIAAAAAKLAGNPSAHHEFALADAFFGAVAALDLDDITPEGELVVEEPLAAPEPVQVARPSKRVAGRTA